jgi:signal transduction histidine kinase
LCSQRPEATTIFFVPTGDPPRNTPPGPPGGDATALSGGPPPRASGPAETPARPLVWLVEDSPTQAEMIVTRLDGEYEIELFENGHSMLERLAAGEAPDVLLLDWLLPDIVGAEVCRVVRAHHDEVALPILVLTGDLSSSVVEALGAGANDFLRKAAPTPELRARVRSLARARRLHESARRAQAAADVERARAEEANRAKDDFLAVVSHELRTPLNAMLGWAHILRSGDLDERNRQRALEIIERNARAQTQLIEDLLDVSRITSGKLRLRVTPVDLRAVVEAAADAVRPAAEAKALSLSTHVDPEASALAGDADRLQQVVWNLLSNAVKFTPEGGRVRARATREGGHVVLRVDDSGAGIDPEFLPYVFERFRQAEMGATRRRAGLGLGLSIVKHLVEMHGGTVSAESEGEGKGASFAVRIPLAPARPERPFHPRAPAPDPAAALRSPPELEGLRVLVVDDEPDARDLMRSILERCKMLVETAADAEEGFYLLCSSRPDLLVSDVAMPGGDGYAFVRRVRELPSDGGGRTPAVAVTAFARSEDRTRALLAGYNHHLPKPVEPGELVAVIASVMGSLAGREAAPRAPG